MLVAESGQNNDNKASYPILSNNIKNNNNNKKCSSTNLKHNNVNYTNLNRKQQLDLKNLLIVNNNKQYSQIPSTSSSTYRINSNSNNITTGVNNAIRSSINCNKKLQSISSLKPLEEISTSNNSGCKFKGAEETLKNPNTVPPTIFHRISNSSEPNSVDSLNLEMCHFKPIKSVPISPLKNPNSTILKFPIVKRLKPKERKCAAYVSPKKGSTSIIFSTSKFSAFYFYSQMKKSPEVIELLDDDIKCLHDDTINSRKIKKPISPTSPLHRKCKAKLKSTQSEKKVKPKLDFKNKRNDKLKNNLKPKVDAPIERITRNKLKTKSEPELDFRQKRNKLKEKISINEKNCKISEVKNIKKQRITKNRQERLDFEFARKLQSNELIAPIATRLRKRLENNATAQNVIQSSNTKVIENKNKISRRKTKKVKK